MLRLTLFLAGLGATALLAAGETEGRSTFPRQLFFASMAVAGSLCGYAAVQTAFRLGRLSRNSEALRPKDPPSSCLVEAWRWLVGAASFLVKSALGIGLWLAVLRFSQDTLR